MTYDYDFIQNLVEKDKIKWSGHILKRIESRNIKIIDVINVLKTGEIIEKYIDDYPYPSCLILGISLECKNIHIVFGIGNDFLWLITAYYPSLKEWYDDFKTRR